jgi:hypothetical protein
MMRKWRLILAAGLLGSASGVLAAPAEAPNPVFTGADLFALSRAADVQISPDGRQVAYVRLSGDIMTDRAARRRSGWSMSPAGASSL